MLTHLYVKIPSNLIVTETYTYSTTFQISFSGFRQNILTSVVTGVV